MLRSDLFDVSPWAAPPERTQLPLHIEPAIDEALMSWLAKTSAALGQSPLTFGRNAFNIDAAKDPEWWRRPTNAVLVAISDRTGIDVARLRAMTFLDWSIARDDEDAERFTSRRWTGQNDWRHRGRLIGVCGRCLAQDERPYLRRLWLVGWVGVCPQHRTRLFGECPTCHRRIWARDLSARTTVDLLACPRCGGKFVGARGQDAHDRAAELQSLLVMGKRTGSLALPGVGEITWPSMMGVIDMLLSMIWFAATARRREQLFRRVARELGLSAEDRLSMDSNYGGLLMLGWLVSDLPRRAPEAIGILRSARFGGLVDRHDSGEDGNEMVARLRGLVATAATRPAKELRTLAARP